MVLRNFSAVALLALSLATYVAAYGSSNAHYGGGRRIPMSSINTLTFYDGEKTTARRTKAVSQLSCIGKACRKFQPDVVSCQSRGDNQWKCEADLPPSLRLGRVEVSCEGYDAPQDPYVLKGSCALTYHLLTAYNSHSAQDNFAGRGGSSNSRFEDFLSFAFVVVFFAVLARILWGFYRSVTTGQAGSRQAGRAGGHGGGGGGGGGGGDTPWWGGWGPGNGPGGGPSPPPPYSKNDPTTDSGTQSGWRPGFWTGLAAGAAGAAMAGRNRGDRSRYYQDTHYDGGGLGAGWTPSGGGGSTMFGGDSRAGPSDLRTSTGYGGTRNR